MNKQELIEAVVKETGFTKADASRSVDAFVSAITKALKKKQNVQLIGFGTFGVTKRKARMGRNPQTGEAIKIKASNAVGFKAGKALKDAVN